MALLARRSTTNEDEAVGTAVGTLPSLLRFALFVRISCAGLFVYTRWLESVHVHSTQRATRQFLPSILGARRGIASGHGACTMKG